MARENLEVNERCLLTELADGTGVILDLDSKFYYTLNTTGVEVWKAVRSGASAVPEIVLRLVSAFEVDAATVEADLDGILRMMLDEGLVRPVRR